LPGKNLRSSRYTSTLAHCHNILLSFEGMANWERRMEVHPTTPMITQCFSFNTVRALEDQLAKTEGGLAKMRILWQKSGICGKKVKNTGDFFIHNCD
jgi:hypothetical protein